MCNDPSVSRRSFLAVTASTPWLAPKLYSQVRGALERIRVGVIGCGGMGMAHIKTLLKMRDSDNVEIAAVCDVYQKRLDAAAQMTGARPYKDYRQLLENREIDYVLIATPEHWHYQMCVDAARAGKHIYCEKPMTQTSEQAKRLVALVDRLKIKLQVGVQGMSDESYEVANQYVREGVLGKVVLAQIDYSRNYRDDFWAYTIDPDIRPGVNFDWQAWLGPAPKRPFDPDRVFRWRRYWDYSSGIASDLFIHRVTRIIKALGLQFPRYGVATGGKFCFTDSRAEIPDTFNVLLDYPEGLTVQLISSLANDTRVQHMLRGHKATLFFTDDGFEIVPQKLYQNEVKPVRYKKTGCECIDLHHRNLLQAIRTGEALKCDHWLGYYGVVACELGTQSYRKRKYMAWDAKRQRIVTA